MSIKSIDLISDAFFASLVIDIITERKELNKETEEILKNALNQILKIKEGKKLVSFEDTDEDYNVSSVAAYSTAIEIIPSLELALGERDDDPPNKCIIKFIETLVEEINHVLAKSKIEEEDLVKTELFFRELRKRSIRDSNNAFMAKREVLSWMEPPVY